MRSTLFYIPAEIGGAPLFGFGLLLILWAVVGFIWLAILVKRHGFSSETLSQIPVWLVLGGVIAFVLPEIAQPEGLPIRGYGVLLLLAVVAGVALAAHRAWRVGTETEQVYSLAFWMFIAGIVGARVFYIIEYWQDYRRESLGETLRALLNITQGGLVVYGAGIGAAAALVVFCVRQKLSVLKTSDLVAPSVALGMAIGRLGCFLNGCCFGGVCDLPWAMTFPFSSPPHVAHVREQRIDLHGLVLPLDPAAPALVEAVRDGSPAQAAGVRAGDQLVAVNGLEVATAGDATRALLEVQGRGATLTAEVLPVGVPGGTATRTWPVEAAAERSLPIHPTQLYSAVADGLLCWLLLAYAPLARRDGAVLALLITVYPITRYLIEIIRTDEPAVFGTGLSISQNISVALLVAAVALWAFLLRGRQAAVAPIKVRRERQAGG